MPSQVGKFGAKRQYDTKKYHYLFSNPIITYSTNAINWLCARHKSWFWELLWFGSGYCLWSPCVKDWSPTWQHWEVLWTFQRWALLGGPWATLTSKELWIMASPLPAIFTSSSFLWNTVCACVCERECMCTCVYVEGRGQYCLSSLTTLHLIFSYTFL